MTEQLEKTHDVCKIIKQVTIVVKEGLSLEIFLLQNYVFMYFHRSIHLNRFMVYWAGLGNSGYPHKKSKR